MDDLLGGRVQIGQPRSGYRATTDAVLLAAAVPAVPGGSVLDLGCGAASAAMCLGARVGQVDLHGLEIQRFYAALARENAALNGQALTVHEGDVTAMPAALRERVFDAVMLNPPWYSGAATRSPNPGRDRARRTDLGIDVWIAAALARTRPGGHLVIIQRSERLAEILAALDGPAGEIAVLPLAARAGRDAKRVIVRARKGVRTPLRLATPLVLHDGANHDRDGDDFSTRAAAILRDGAALEF